MPLLGMQLSPRLAVKSGISHLLYLPPSSLSWLMESDGRWKVNFNPLAYKSTFVFTVGSMRLWVVLIEAGMGSCKPEQE